MADLFFPQTVLDEWIAAEKIQLTADTLVLAGRTYKLEGAVHVLKCVSEEVDPHDLVHRVRRLEELLAQGADTLQSSLIFKEQAYEVDPGFIGHVEESAVKPEAVATAARARAVRRTMSIQLESPLKAEPGGQEGRLRPLGKDKASQDAARIAAEKLARDAKKKSGATAPGASGGAGKAGATAGAKDGKPFTDEELLTNFLLENL